MTAAGARDTDLERVIAQRDAWRELALALDELRLCERRDWPRRLARATLRVSAATSALEGLGVQPALATIGRQRSR
jgi:hypothetical protein